MKATDNMFRLTFYIGEEQKYHRKPLFEEILKEAHSRGISGATVFRGMAGYGTKNQMRSSQILRLSENLPVVIQLVDLKEPLLSLADFFGEAVGKGLITIEPVTVLTCDCVIT